jgi:tetratricopeptide (TPR) repeat protein
LRSLSIRRAAFGKEHLLVAASLNNLGLAYANMGRAREAQKAFEEGLAIHERVPGGGQHHQLVALLGNFGLLMMKTDPERSLKFFRRALQLNESAWGTDHPLNGLILMNMGKALLQQEKFGQAVPHLQRALKIREMNHQSPLEVGLTQFALGKALWGSGLDRAKGKKMVASAKESFARATSEENVKATDRWLATHSEPNRW